MKLPILPKSCIFTVVLNVLAVLPLPPHVPSPAVSFILLAVWPCTMGWLLGAMRKKAKKQAFFISVRSLLGMTSGEGEG